MRKKLISLLIIITMMAGIVCNSPVSTYAAWGEGTVENPYTGEIDKNTLIAGAFYYNFCLPTTVFKGCTIYINGETAATIESKDYYNQTGFYLCKYYQGSMIEFEEVRLMRFCFYPNITQNEEPQLTIGYAEGIAEGINNNYVYIRTLRNYEYVLDKHMKNAFKVKFSDNVSLPTRTGYILEGWTKSRDGIAYVNYYIYAEIPVSAISDSGNCRRVYAVWSPYEYTINYYPNTTDSAAAITSTLFDFENTPIAAATTLYAIWEPHDHVWAYAADGNKLYAYCTVDGYNCSYYGTESDLSKAISVELNAPEERSGSLAYDGNDYVAILTDAGNKWSTTFSSLPSIDYGYKEFGMEAASYSDVTETKDAGYYKASIKAGEKTAYVEYQIAKKSVTISVTMDDCEVNSQPSDTSVSGGPDGAAYDYKFKKKGADDSTYSDDVPTTPWGDYTVKATYAGDKNHESATATCDFQITPEYRTETIKTIMSGYVYGTTTAPTPSTDPAVFDENPSVTYKYRVLGSTDEWIDWTGNSSALDVLSDTGKYEMIAVIGATATYAERQSSSVRFTVTKGEWKVTAPTAKTLKYNCANQELVNAGSVEDGGKLLYSINETDYYESLPQTTDAGTYNVYYKVEADTNHNEYVCDSPVSVTIAKADWDVTAPTAIAPSFTGSAQALINAGVVKDADGSTVSDKLLYRLNGDTDDYSTSIPTATDGGNYTVYYKVAGDDNHNEYAAKTITATIEKISRLDVPTVSMDGYTYGQTSSIPTPALSATPSENPTITYYYNDTDAVDGADEWENITSTMLDAGTYYMFACIGETASYRECYTASVQFVIAKAECTDITAPVGLTPKYNGQPQTLVSAGSSTQGTMMYSLTGNAGDFAAELPQETNAGTYTVYYKIAGDENHNDSGSDSLTVTIAKADWAVTAPMANSLYYTGENQTLVTAGTVKDVTGAAGEKMYYRLAGETDYSENIPTGNAVDTYRVEYKVAGSANYNEYTGTAPVTVTIGKTLRTDIPTVSMSGYTYAADAVPAPSVTPATLTENPTVTYFCNTVADTAGAEEWANITSTTLDAGTYYMFALIGATESYGQCYTDFVQFDIAKADCTDITAPAGLTLKYNGQPQALVSAGSSAQGTMMYSLTGNAADFAAELPKETNAGTYTVYYKVAGDENHNDSGSDSLIVTTAKADWTVTAPMANSLYYSGKNQALVTAGTVKGAKTSDSATMLYSLIGENDYSASIPTGKSVGTYKVEYKVAGTANYNEYTGSSPVTVTIGQTQRTDIPAVSMSGYKYGTDAVPEPSVTPAELAENPTVTYFYNSAADLAGAEVWEDITSTTLSAGTYYMFALIGATESYGQCYTEFAKFDIAKADPIIIINPQTTPAPAKEDAQSSDTQSEDAQSEGMTEGAAADAETPTEQTETPAEEYTAPVVEYDEQIEAGEAFVPVKAEVSDGIATVEEITEAELRNLVDEIMNAAAKTEDKETEGAADESQNAGDKETEGAADEGRKAEGEENEGTAGENQKTEGGAADSKEAENSKGNEVTALTIDLSQATQDVTGVDLTAKTLEVISDIVNDESNPIESVKLEFSEAIVELDAKTLEAVIEEAEGDIIRLVVEDTEVKNLNKSQSATIKSLAVDRTFEAYFESAGKKIHDFKGGNARVSLSFKPGKGKRVENYKVFYIDENGKPQKMTTKYENGLITFVTSHFSDYAVVYENVQDVLLTEASMTSKGYIKLSWNEIDGAVKYVVYGARCGKSYKQLAELDAATDGSAFTVKKINGAKPVSGKTYKFYVAAYDALGNRIKSKAIHFLAGNISGECGNVETITALQRTLTLSVGEKAVVGAEYTMYEDKKHISKSHGKALRFTSDCPDVAKVAKDGTITAKGEGKAIIYIQDVSGKWCQVEVTVKEK